MTKYADSPGIKFCWFVRYFFFLPLYKKTVKPQAAILIYEPRLFDLF